jgi:alkanesulfonate monooxygenase SsuD/methylene tetrahydromethanopterin reductase-like flavin-dependent oxidoreductase (luciferase family)
MGVGRGNRPTEFRGYHVPQQESRARFEEAVDILMHAWTEEHFSYAGCFFTIKDARVIPRPVQQPHPPMYQGCVSRDGIEAAARRGWAMLNSVLFGTLEPLVTSRDTYVDALRQAGRSAPEIQALLARWGVSRPIYVAPTDAQAFAEAKEAEMWYQESFTSASSFLSALRTRTRACNLGSVSWQRASTR